MHSNRVLSAWVAALSLAVSAPAPAHTIVYTAPFSSEVSGGTGTGSATVTIDADLFTMRVQADFTGLSGVSSAAHIHCCTVNSGTGNAGVATVVPSFTLFPLGVTAGTHDFTYDLTLTSSYNSAFVTANGGTATTAFNALVAGLDARKAYFNIHTSTFQGGEIRAILTPVPEPAVSALLALGLGWLARRRSRA